VNIKLHKNARTTPAVRAEMAASTERVCVLAKRYGVTEATVYKWRGRQSFEDKSHTAHDLQTTLTPAQEAIVVDPKSRTRPSKPTSRVTCTWM
jgi:transposase-like protein